jgi:hypothetical protein
MCDAKKGDVLREGRADVEMASRTLVVAPTGVTIHAQVFAFASIDESGLRRGLRMAKLNTVLSSPLRARGMEGMGKVGGSSGGWWVVGGGWWVVGGGWWVVGGGGGGGWWVVVVVVVVDGSAGAKKYRDETYGAD